MDPMRYLETSDSLIRSIMFHIAETYQERRQIRDENLATDVVNKIGKAYRA